MKFYSRISLINFIANHHNYYVCISMIFQFRKPFFSVLECLFSCDVIANQSSYCTSIISISDGSISIDLIVEYLSCPAVSHI